MRGIHPIDLGIHNGRIYRHQEQMADGAFRRSVIVPPIDRGTVQNRPFTLGIAGRPELDHPPGLGRRVRSQPRLEAHQECAPSARPWKGTVTRMLE